jgi:hypothetical protein
MRAENSQEGGKSGRRSKKASSLPVFLFLFLSFSCGLPTAKAPTQNADLAAMFAAAFRADAIGDAHDAVKQHLDVVRAAARADRVPWQVDALEASLDALATRSMPSLGDAGRDGALASRTRAADQIAGELAVTMETAAGPFAKGIVSRALTSIAQRRGDASEAEKWTTASGCVREALVIGPTTWAPVTGVDEAGPLDNTEAPIAKSYAGADAFDATVHPVLVQGRGCAIDLSAESWRPGVREVVVDVDVPRAQTIGIALRSHGSAKLRAGGAVVVRRAFELGDGEVARFARLTVASGVLRVAARVGTAKEDDSVEIDVWGQDGAPLHSHAPAVGSTAGGRVLGVQAAVTPAPQRDDEVLLASAAALASGDAREAERLVWPAVAHANARPELALAYARAVETARDLSPATRAERARSGYERVLEIWPGNWEAAVAHAVLAGVRRGRDEGGVEVLRDLDATRAKFAGAVSPLLDAFEALASGRERLFDRAKAALERARASLSGTAFFADAESAVVPRLGADLVATSCDPGRATARDTLACFDALRSHGDHVAAMSELARLRAVVGAPARFLPLELREAMSSADENRARRVYGAMLAAERSLAGLSFVDRSPDVASSLLRAATTARDAPASIAPLLRSAGDDPTREFEGVAERVIAGDRATPIMPSAATAVLAHVERYSVADSGLARWLLFDVRRVSGTTDVEENAQAAAPEVWGRGVMRALRRRIFKRDGRVLEPERTPGASQAHADLSQLEQGDIIEALYEGWLLPGDTGDLGIDTPDILPERTAVHEATIELRLPQGLRGSLWSHSLLGKPAERAEGGARVLSWHVVDQPARRIEDGVPKMDRNVDVSFSTADWRGVARALRETIAELDEHDPEITAWAHEAAGEGAKPLRPTVDAVVAATGRALREADPGTLSDYGGGVAPVQSRTARTFVTSHDGSRSWLVVRALRELAIPCDVVVAENEPYSADPAFPPHFGRFSHPLVVAHAEGKDVWVDADVQGPPLPAGRISPELRGRLALRTDGTIAVLPALGNDDERDEVDVRLTLDERGDARGTFAVVLRGRDAQELSEAFFRIVGAERQRALRDVVLAWLPWANVDDVRLASSEGSWQISLRADVSVSGYAQLEAGKTWLLPGLDAMHWSWPHAHVSSLGTTFASRAGRESALALSAAVQYHVHRRIDLPKGASVARMPGPVDIRGKLVEASRSIGVADDGHVIEDDFTLGVATGTIAAKDYDAFVSVAHATDDGFLASTRVAMP